MSAGGFPAFARRFAELFPGLGSPVNCMDWQLSAVTLRPQVDVCAFETMLEHRHGKARTARLSRTW